jgi:hypothetical protein
VRLFLDAGAFIAFERRDRDGVEIVERTLVRRVSTVTHGGVVGQVWRKPGGQVAIAKLLRGTDVRPLDAALGRDAGRLLAASGTSDVIDAALVALMRDGDRIVTSDPEDIAVLIEAAQLDVELLVV